MYDDGEFMPSNFSVNVTAAGEITLGQVLQLAFKKHGPAKAYRMEEPSKLLFFWKETRSSTSFGGPMKGGDAADFAWKWLGEQEYGEPPLVEGRSKPNGWSVSTEGSDEGLLVMIEPTYSIFLK